MTTFLVEGSEYEVPDGGPAAEVLQWLYDQYRAMHTAVERQREFLIEEGIIASWRINRAVAYQELTSVLNDRLNTFVEVARIYGIKPVLRQSA